MFGAVTTTTSPRAALHALVERFDPDVIDLPSGRARIRLAVRDGDSWDAVIRGPGDRAPRGGRPTEPDAVLSADAATWERIARDVRGGMEAFRSRKLSVRQNLHVGVGFLAATSDIADDRRLRFDTHRTRDGRISTLSAGAGDPVVCLHGLGGTKASFLPTDRRAGRGLPGDRDGPARLRRVRQAAARRLRRALLRRLGHRAARRARDRARPPDRQQHGRARRDRGRPAAPRARRAPRAAEPRPGLAARPPLALAAAGAAAQARADPARAAGDHRAHRPQPRSRRQARAGRRRGSTSSCAPT